MFGFLKSRELFSRTVYEIDNQILELALGKSFAYKGKSIVLDGMLFTPIRV